MKLGRSSALAASKRGRSEGLRGSERRSEARSATVRTGREVWVGRSAREGVTDHMKGDGDMATEEDFRLWEAELSEVDESEIAELYDATRDMLGAIDPEEAARTLDGMGDSLGALNARRDLMRLTVGELFAVALAQNRLLAVFLLDDESDRQGADLIETAVKLGRIAARRRSC